MAGGLRRLDAFVKPRHDLRTRSTAGGIITLVALSTAGLLFVSQLLLYARGATKHSLHLAESTTVPVPKLGDDHHHHHRYHHPHNGVSPHQTKHGKIPLTFQITFPNLHCNQLDFMLDGASHSTGLLETAYGKQAITFRPPTYGELQKAKAIYDSKTRAGCTVEGSLNIPLVAGDFSITITRRTWAEATSTLLLGLLDDRMVPDSSAFKSPQFNVSHYIHFVRFGTPFPLAAANPLEHRHNIIQNRMGGIALQQIRVKLIPTLYQRFVTTQMTYQLSVVEHTVQPETLVAKGVPLLPGISISYDFTPLAVHHLEVRDNILVFLGSLVSIVGGVFVTVGLVTGCLVHSAQAVAKKLD